VEAKMLFFGVADVVLLVMSGTEMKPGSQVDC
jgi:hypothetical protein